MATWKEVLREDTPVGKFPTLNQATTGNADTATTASIATTVTITDNENTNEENAILFSAGADADGGNLGIEQDHSGMTYNPSTGTITATVFSGALTGNASGTAATVTGATQAAITTLANVTEVGTIGTGVWQGTDVGIAYGGTGQSTAAAGANALLNTSQGGSLTIGDSDDTITVAGDLVVSGDTTTINVGELTVEDKNILLASGSTSTSTADGAGLTVSSYSIGTINHIVVTPGNSGGYAVNDTFTINNTGTGGSGFAFKVATISSSPAAGTISTVEITNAGDGNYTSAPTVTGTSGSGSGASFVFTVGRSANNPILFWDADSGNDELDVESSTNPGLTGWKVSNARNLSTSNPNFAIAVMDFSTNSTEPTGLGAGIGTFHFDAGDDKLYIRTA
jgi:hypothetical protein